MEPASDTNSSETAAILSRQKPSKFLPFGHPADGWANGLLRIREWACKRLDREAANDEVFDSPSQNAAAVEIVNT